MATSESDLKEQLADLDWGTETSAPAPELVGVTAMPEAPADTSGDALDFDVAVPGVSTRAPRKVKTRAPKVKRGPNAQALLDAARDGQTVDANQPAVGQRRGRNTAPDVLTQAGESPAVLALFEQMWKDVGSKLAKGIGRPKASRQDAAIGWYALLLAMRERDAAK